MVESRPDGGVRRGDAAPGDSVVGLPWRLVRGDGDGLQPLVGCANMAVDAALLASVKAGAAPALRLYRWAPACLSFGRNQPARGRYDREAAAARGIDFVRRPTGGQAVLHADELTYAVVAPVSVIGKPRAAYRGINRALVEGLSRLGVRAALAGGGGLGSGDGAGGGGRLAGLAAEDARAGARQRSSGGPDWDRACFRRPERGEVVVDGAKLVGSAQRMEERVILQHGSILVGGSQAAAEELLVGSRSTSTSTSISRSTSRSTSTSTSTSTSSGWTTLEQELGVRPSLAEIAEAVAGGFEEALGIRLRESSLTAEERERAEAAREQFGSEEWTWRR